MPPKEMPALNSVLSSWDGPQQSDWPDRVSDNPEIAVERSNIGICNSLGLRKRIMDPANDICTI
jgi:hypothetical protein|tara:strand:+ start:2540 stop:2731 length:192 start_codon:yes stop_codon:yes gene_type:complete